MKTNRERDTNRYTFPFVSDIDVEISCFFQMKFLINNL